ncbi:MAG: hypothetical protein SF051_08190 [Elusimicrobiota bacterium]|nr:hypothetical protein [Elusimicrobiota bacterium]
MKSFLLCAALTLPAAAEPPVGPGAGLAQFEGVLRDIAAGARAAADDLRDSVAGRPAPVAPAPAPVPTAEITDLTAYFDHMPGIVMPGAPADPRELHVSIRVSNPTDRPLTYRVVEAAVTTLPLVKGAPVALNDADGAPAIGVDRTLAPGAVAHFQLRGAFGRAAAGERLRATVTVRLGEQTVTLRASAVIDSVQ